jgi:hypothetical protein
MKTFEEFKFFKNKNMPISDILYVYKNIGRDVAIRINNPEEDLEICRILDRFGYTVGYTQMSPLKIFENDPKRFRQISKARFGQKNVPRCYLITKEKKVWLAMLKNCIENGDEILSIDKFLNLFKITDDQKQKLEEIRAKNKIFDPYGEENWEDEI